MYYAFQNYFVVNDWVKSYDYFRNYIRVNLPEPNVSGHKFWDIYFYRIEVCSKNGQWWREFGKPVL